MLPTQKLHQRFGGTCCLHLHPEDGGSMELRNIVSLS